MNVKGGGGSKTLSLEYFKLFFLLIFLVSNIFILLDLKTNKLKPSIPSSTVRTRKLWNRKTTVKLKSSVSDVVINQIFLPVTFVNKLLSVMGLHCSIDV